MRAAPALMVFYDHGCKSATEPKRNGAMRETHLGVHLVAVDGGQLLVNLALLLHELGNILLDYSQMLL